MKMNYIVYSIVVCLVALGVIYVTTNNSYSDSKPEELPKVKIDINTDSLINYLTSRAIVEFGFVMRNKEFKYIADNPELYFNDIKRIINNCKEGNIKGLDTCNIKGTSRELYYHETKMIISIISMHKLNITQYMELCYLSIDIFNKDYIADEVFEWCIQGFYHDSPILKNLNNKIVKQFFLDIMNNEKFSKEFKMRIQEYYK